ncbi:MAG: PD-(D/E)XK nuclease family protein [Spirochaetota bacterium]
MSQQKLITMQRVHDSSTRQWSYSRREVLEQCPRRYYYQYFGSAARTAKTEPHKHMLRFLKGISNRYLRVGDIMHLIIRTYLTKLRSGDAWSLEWLLNWASDIYHRDMEYSRSYDVSSHAEEKYPPVLLLEFYYQQDNADRSCAESEQRLNACFDGFY